MPPRPCRIRTPALHALALAAALGWGAVPGAARAARAPADSPALASPAAQVLAAEQPAPWWAGFHDPALDALQRNAQAAAPTHPADDGYRVDERSARVATLYVLQRGLDGRLAVAAGLRQLLARQRQWALLPGPTAEAAQALAVLDQDDAALRQRIAELAARAEQVAAELRQLGALADTPEALLAPSGPAPWAVPRFEPGRREAGVKPWSGEQPGAEALAPLAARLQALEGRNQALGERFQAALQALAAGQVTEREVLQIHQALLLQTDAVLQLRSALAMGWVRLLSGR